ncbi:MAG TPA: phosphoribosyltransferase family protein [Anaeromyxobacteraceae bacterium]|nr:phosphoribosyltransferase family protein [Anaeromyxobacteraceae bacterium]
MSLDGDRKRLLELLRSLSFERRKVILASGKESDFYVDCKRTALTAEGHALVGRLLLERIRRLDPPPRAAGGLTLGADPLASAVAMASWLEYERWFAAAGEPEVRGAQGQADEPAPERLGGPGGQHPPGKMTLHPPSPIDAFIVRKEPKGHGTGQWIEGRKTIPDGSRVVVLEDVVTSGGSALKAIERCRAETLEVMGCFALVDRLEGGREAIEAQGVPLDSLFTRQDFLG